MNSNHIASEIELMISDSKAQFESIKAIVELWKGRVQNQKTLKDEWNQLVTPTVNTENYSEVFKFYEKKLDEIQPMLKVSNFSYF